MEQSSAEVIIPPPNDKTAKFVPLLLNLVLKSKLGSEKFKIIPYDLFCPSIQNVLENSVCKECGIYFASNKSMLAHFKAMHKAKKVPEPVKIRPVRVAAQRAKE